MAIHDHELRRGWWTAQIAGDVLQHALVRPPVPAEHFVKCINTEKMREAGLDVDVDGDADRDQPTRVMRRRFVECGPNGAHVSRKAGIP